MSRLDWDRLRRVRPLDGADARVDPDGAVVWERAREQEDADDRRALAIGARKLRAGVVVRRAKERTARSAVVDEVVAAASVPAPVLEKCPKCGAMVSKRRMFRHSRVACRGRGRS